METVVFLTALAEHRARLAKGEVEALASSALGLPVSVSYAKSGKPLLSSSRFGVSVSHSGALAVVAVGDACVGADIQQHRRAPYLELAERFFHPSEAEAVRRFGEAMFFDIWTAKEAYVKYTGEGISGGFSRFSVADGGGLAPSINGLALTRLACGADYSLTVCHGGAGVILTEV